jgi:hypothetical protein
MLDATREREAAERARAEAERQFQTSEYPRYGRATHLEVAAAHERMAETLEEFGTEPPAPTGNAFSDRRARRVWALRIKAARKRVESAQLAARSHDMGSRRPLGQPIVGCASRQRAQRNAIERERRVDERAHEAYREAQELERRASAAERNGAVFQDDPEAIEKLREKLARLERDRAALKARRVSSTLPLLNYRAESVTVVSPWRSDPMILPVVEISKAEYARLHTDHKGTRPVSWAAHRVRTMMHRTPGQAPYGGSLVVAFLTDSKAHPIPTDAPAIDTSRETSAYQLSNLSARIADVRKRIEALEAREAADAAAGGEDRVLLELPGCRVVERIDLNRYALESSGKPSREVTQECRKLGLRWWRSESVWVAWRNGAGRYAIEQAAKGYSHWYTTTHPEAISDAS